MKDSPAGRIATSPTFFSCFFKISTLLKASLNSRAMPAPIFRSLLTQCAMASPSSHSNKSCSNSSHSTD